MKFVLGGEALTVEDNTYLEFSKKLWNSIYCLGNRWNTMDIVTLDINGNH